MAFDEFLAERIRTSLNRSHIIFSEKKMMGGLCFMVDDKMLMGVERERLMARIGPEVYEEALSKPGCSEMDFTGRPLKGYVYVSANALDSDEELDSWIRLCLDFNPMAVSSKKKSGKAERKSSA